MEERKSEGRAWEKSDSIVFYSIWVSASVGIAPYPFSPYILPPRGCTLELHPLGHNIPWFQLSLAKGSKSEGR